MTRRLFGLLTVIGLIRLIIISTDHMDTRLSAVPQSPMPASAQALNEDLRSENILTDHLLQGPVPISNKEAGPFGPAPEVHSRGSFPTD